MIKYTSILQLNVKHGYYDDGACPDMVFSPTEQTLSLVNGYRLLIKYKPAGLEVFAPLDADDKLLIPLEKDLKFQWLLQTVSNTFFSMTALPPKDSNGQYNIGQKNSAAENAAAIEDYGGLYNETDKIQVSGMSSLTKLFSTTYELQSGKKTHQIKLERLPVLGASDTDFVYEYERDENDSDIKSLKYKLADRGTLNATSNTLSAAAAVKITYPVAAKESNGAFALLDIKLGKSFSGKTDKEIIYTLNFRAAKVTWQYFIITGKSTLLELNKSWRLKIENGAPFHTVKVINTNESMAPPPENIFAGMVWQKLKSGIDFNSQNVYFFYSEEAMPLKAKPTSGIIIQQQKSGNTWGDIITELPSPGPGDNGLRVIYHPTISLTQ